MIWESSAWCDFDSIDWLGCSFYGAPWIRNLNTFPDFVHSTDHGSWHTNAEFFQAGLGLTFN